MKGHKEDSKLEQSSWDNNLFQHSDNKFKEYLSIGNIFQKMSDEIMRLSDLFGILNKDYYKPDEPNYSREEGIEVILSSFQLIKSEFEKLASNLGNLAIKILEKREHYESKKTSIRMYEESNKKYNEELSKSQKAKTAYYDAVNKVVEIFLNDKYGKKSKSNKDLNNKLKILEKNRAEYKALIDSTEKWRVEYLILQGNIFAMLEENERDCTDDIKIYLKTFIKTFEEIFKNYKLTTEQINTIEKINGKSDTKKFDEMHKSSMASPKKPLYEEYEVDVKYYMENFKIIKSKLKGKNQNEQIEFQKELYTEVTNYLYGNIIKQETDKTTQRILQIAKDLEDNKLSKNDFSYLISITQDHYEQFLKWKEEHVANQDYRKIGKEWDERFCYMETFFNYFNKKGIENKELNQENFDYLCELVKKTLELNENEDIDFNLCDMIVRLSSKFYTVDKISGKKYLYEVIRNCSIMQKQGFWVRLTMHELNEEIAKKEKLDNTSKGNDKTNEQKYNSVITNLSVFNNIVRFILDSNLFNSIIADIFKFIKIEEQNRRIIVENMESIIIQEKIDYLKLEKEMLISGGLKKEEKKEDKKEGEEEKKEK